jgi:hypothetical protein
VPLWKVGVFVGDIVVEGDSDGVTVYTEGVIIGDIVVEGDSDGVTVYTEGVIIGESDTLTTVIAS